MKILLLGKNGQVGWELQRSLAPLGELVALDRRGGEGLVGDLADAEGLRATVRAVRPDVIVNAAAYTAVDKAESEPERAEAINAIAPGILAEEAASQNALLVHYSTDYVFDGSGDAPWAEDDGAVPLNVYGATKWRGEEAIRTTGARHLIFRTQWVYAARGHNFLRTMLRLARERDRLQVVNDQFGAPTGAELIADATAHALRRVLGDPGCAGTFHLAAAGETTWHGYARFAIAVAREQGGPVKVADEAIEPVPTSTFPTPARRPRNSRLALNRIERVFGLKMPAWQEGVRRTVVEMVASGLE